MYPKLLMKLKFWIHQLVLILQKLSMFLQLQVLFKLIVFKMKQEIMQRMLLLPFDKQNKLRTLLKMLLVAQVKILQQQY